ncbi:Eco57I restriction-modification methylase domain-containing protein [Leeuwenhoekiella sp. LLG6367-2.1]|uniref:Eco57I restriction-modification methylase domain-containing protein n=1 Tax=Leeuwenhoekiella sp. LLG6367-2.1 TaxID=3160833 RepID=UPI00386AD164
MALFQNSVLNKYLKAQDDRVIAKAYKIFSAYFLNPVIQENIRKSKEEQFQATFLHELFVNILGYTLNPNPNYDLTTEFKNEKNNRKADGAILKSGSATGVIELKGTNTKDLESIRRQAFDYKANQKGCIYVITSNFEKLRFYINDATEFEEFNLFELTQERFALLFLCLQRENLMSDLPLKIKEASIAEEEAITKNFYKDYSIFKRELFRDLVKRNVKRIRTSRQEQLDAATTAELTEEERAERNRLDKNVKLTLFKKSQKLIDRFLFIFFAEDRGLLPPNSTLKILDEFEKLKEMDAHVPLYDRFKLYFNYLDQGRKGTDRHAEIYAYNGGLFKPDAILDQLVIDDALLLTHTRKLANYDFESQVDVNILGHIFENSLNEIESVNAEIEGDTFDKQTSKRKKDGVFYTPKYITKYIVENTVGKLCEDKKAELGFEEAEYFKSRKGRNKDTLLKLVDILDTYREWLLQITICDPACGSGAFLNQALDFLIKEHGYIDELKAKVLGGGLVFADIENTILENNIYGVDLNEESVEIAKLSLWLRTAQPRRKLNDLSSNIKCGNSLIDNKAVAGDKAFKWEQEFPKIFEKGGFDVVIGNPPYVRVQSLKEHYFNQTLFLENNFVSATGKYDLYVLFIEQAYRLINLSGEVSFILPHKFLVADFGAGIRAFLAEKNAVSIIIHFGSELVFQDASTYTCIINLNKFSQSINYSHILPDKILEPFSVEKIEYDNLSSKPWLLKNKIGVGIIDKVVKEVSLKSICEGIYQGLITTGDDIFMLEGEIKGDSFFGFSKALNCVVELEKNILKEVLKGQDIKRYLPLKSNKYVIYPHFKDEEGKTKPIEEEVLQNEFPLTYGYLLNFKDPLIKKKIRYKTNSDYWYSLHRSREISVFERDYIITPQLQNKPSFTIKKTDVYADAGGYLLIPLNYSVKNLLPILNSKLMWYFIKNTSSEYSGGYYYFKTKYLEPFGIPVDRLNNYDFKKITNLVIQKTEINQHHLNKFLIFFASQYKLEKLSRKLENWHELEFDEFIKELNKSIKANNKLREKAAKEAAVSSSEAVVTPSVVEVPPLTKKDEFEWMSLFEENKKKAQDLQTQIAHTEIEIDQMVYELYGLTEKEIQIVENS